MEFAYYSPTDESRSCVVRTMTKLTGRPYQTVKSELAALAAELGYPDCNEPAVFERYLAACGICKDMGDCGLQVRDLPPLDGVCCVLGTNKAGFFHLFPVIDNVIYDRRDDSHELWVLAVYRQKKDSVFMILRDYQPADAEIICKWLRTEKELYQWSADRFNKFPLTADDINENYALQTAGGRFLPLTAVDAENRVIGHFIIRYPHEDDDSTVRFGFVVIDPAQRGKGYGREMLRLGIEYVKDNLNAARIDLGVFANNPSAQRCYEALGFREYGRRQCEMPVGTWECTDMELFTDGDHT